MSQRLLHSESNHFDHEAAAAAAAAEQDTHDEVDESSGLVLRTHSSTSTNDHVEFDEETDLYVKLERGKQTCLATMNITMQAYRRFLYTLGISRVESGKLNDTEHAASCINQDELVAHEDDESLKRTGRLFGGLINDIKRKSVFYVSDFRDALHMQTLATIIYIYLATITKAITFGGFLSDITDGRQGVLEAFLGHALAGSVFCLFGGQPLTVLGCTGPVLIFEKILVDFCAINELDYMTMRLWIGLWSCFFCIIIVAFDLSSFVRYFTRFTEESFAALVGIIFIFESLKKLYSKYYF
jgi:hypothetical protein